MATKRSFRKMLDQIDKFLSGNDGEAVRLWDVLSALRGPDELESGVKYATTGLIRTRAFPLAADNRNSSLPATFEDYDSGEYVDVRKGLSSDHFVRHSQLAFRALGLEWDKSNGDIASSAARTAKTTKGAAADGKKTRSK